MIHHISISALDARHVAAVLAELFDGIMERFEPHAGAYIALACDEWGTAVEVYPFETELVPGSADGPASFSKHEQPSRYSPVHVAISTVLTKEQIYEIARRERWRTLEFFRGPSRVIEFWVENRVLLELLTIDMKQEYLRTANLMRKSRAGEL